MYCLNCGGTVCGSSMWFAPIAFRFSTTLTFCACVRPAWLVVKKNAGVVPKEIRLWQGYQPTFDPRVLLKGEHRPSFLALDRRLVISREARERPVDVDGVDARLSYAREPHCIQEE